METNPSTSLLIYLYADELLSAPRGMLSMAALAPRSGEKVDLKELVRRTYAAAFFDLVDGGAVAFQPQEVKKFLGLGRETALMAAPRGGAAAPAGGTLAALLLEKLLSARKPEEQRVREAVIKQVGGRSSTKMPWHLALSAVSAEAVRAGVVHPPEKKAGILKAMLNPVETTRVEPDLTVIEALRTQAMAASGRLDQFLAFQGENGERLLKEIEDGVNACMDHSD